MSGKQPFIQSILIACVFQNSRGDCQSFLQPYQGCQPYL